MKIIAVGNPFCGDDGIGAAVLERIREGDVFPEAELIDLRTDALALIDHFVPGERHVVVDAARMGLPPGEVVGFGPEEARLRIQSDRLSLHGFGLAEAFEMARSLGHLPDRVLVIGVEPEHVEPDRGLSPTVRGAIPRVLSIIQAEVQSDGREDHPRHRR